jgi:hypothetical protein
VGVFTVLPIAWAWLMRSEWSGLKGWRWFAEEQVRVRTVAASRESAADLSDSSLRRSHEAPLQPVWNVALLVAPLLGLALYFALMWNWTGNPFEGMEAQEHWKAHSISNLWDIPKFVIGFFDPTRWHAFRGSVLDRCMFMLLAFCLPVIWRLGKDLVVWTYVLGILPAMSGTFVSFTRFESTAFPLFIALAVFLKGQKRRWPLMAVITVMSALHLILLWRFVNYRWAG